MFNTSYLQTKNRIRFHVFKLKVINYITISVFPKIQNFPEIQIFLKILTFLKIKNYPKIKNFPKN